MRYARAAIEGKSRLWLGCILKSYVTESYDRVTFRWPIGSREIFAPFILIGRSIIITSWRYNFRTHLFNQPTAIHDKRNVAHEKIDLKMAAPRSSDRRDASIWDASLRDPSGSRVRAESELKWRPIDVSRTTWQTVRSTRSRRSDEYPFADDLTSPRVNHAIMNCHQILSGACNAGDRCYAVGSVEGISFTVSLPPGWRCVIGTGSRDLVSRPLRGRRRAVSRERSHDEKYTYSRVMEVSWSNDTLIRRRLSVRVSFAIDDFLRRKRHIRVMFYMLHLRFIFSTDVSRIRLIFLVLLITH